MVEGPKSRRRQAQGPNIFAIVLGPIGVTVAMTVVIGMAIRG